MGIFRDIIRPIMYGKEVRKTIRDVQGKELKTCENCGKIIKNTKNIKGRCVKCGKIVCISCSEIIKSKLICSDCLKTNKRWCLLGNLINEAKRERRIIQGKNK